MERAEFEKLALAELDSVYRLSLQLTRDPEAANDLVQETFVRALKPTAVARFEDRSADGASGMRSWLFTIAHNTFYSSIKRQARAPVAVGEFFDEASSETPPGEAPPAWDLASLDWEQVDGRLKRAIDDLRPDYRQILLLWGVQGMKYREIAELLDVPIGTIMSRLHRARKILMDALGGPNGAAQELGVRGDAIGGNNGGEDDV